MQVIPEVVSLGVLATEAWSWLLFST